MRRIWTCRIAPLTLALSVALAASPARAETAPLPPNGAGASAAPGEAEGPIGGSRAWTAADWEEGESIVWDPFERMNRGIFELNETLDRWFFEPVAIGWDFVAPKRVQICIGNFFTNLVYPVRLANDVLQLKPVKAVEDTGRFVTNTLVGIGGLFDPATLAGIPRHDEDFGQTLGRWGVPPGPYLVLPFLGPSNPRDGVGLAVDSVFAVQTFFVSFPILLSAAAVNAVNDRALTLEQVRAERAAAFDFYAAVRTGYSQFREGRVRDREVEPTRAQADEDLYYLEDEEDFEYE
jgi:phospholipid-binding lipoprotein MlaA